MALVSLDGAAPRCMLSRWASGPCHPSRSCRCRTTASIGRSTFVPPPAGKRLPTVSRIPEAVESIVRRSPHGVHVTDNEGLTATQVWLAARKHWLLIVVVCSAVTAATAFYVLGQKRIYRSATTILIDPNPPQPLGEEVERVVDFSAYWSNKEYYATQIEVIRSRQIATEVVSNLALNHDGGFVLNAPPGQKAATTEVPIERAARILMSRVSVEAQPKTRIVEVTYDDANPERARRILTALVRTYIQHNLDELATSSESASTWLHNQLGKLKQELETTELALHQYKIDKRILSVSFDDQTNMLREEIAQLNSRITTLRTDRAKLASRLATLEKMNPQAPETLPTSEMLARPMLEQLRQDYVGAMRKRDEINASGKGSNHPEMQSAQSNVDLLKRALETEISNIREGVSRDLEALRGELSQVQGLFEQAKQEALDLNLLDIKYKRLRRLRDNNEKLYGMVLERSKESDLASLMRVNNIRVLDPPLDGAQLGFRIPVQIAFGLLGGLLLGFLSAVAREMLDRTVKSPDELEQELGIPILGVLPKEHFAQPSVYGRRRSRTNRAPRGSDSTGSLELLVHEQSDSATAEAARAVRTNLLFMSPDKPYRTILVTSPGPGDGKTTVATWIAIAMAQAGHRVLLLDCDLRRPRIHKVFNRNSGCTVAQAVLNRSLVDSADMTTHIPNLSVLPAGGHVPNPAEILGSASFQALLEHLESRFERIVIDSPPIAAVTDATILSTRVDGTVLVVRAMVTAKDLARRAARAIRGVDGPLVGAIMNAADPSRGGYYDYYASTESRKAREDAA